MTARDDLREEVAYAVRRKASLYISTLEGEQIADAILPIIAREVEAAKRDTREACAKVVMKFADCITSGSIHPANKAGQDADYAMCEDIAAAIRGEPT